MAEDTAAVIASVEAELETVVEGLKAEEAKAAGDSGAAQEATQPAEKPAEAPSAPESPAAEAPAASPAPAASQAPVEQAPVPQAEPEAAPRAEFKDSVGNVFDKDGNFIRREDGFGGTGRA